MADHPNAALLRKGYEAFDKGDVTALTEMFAEDVVWHVAGNNPLSGEHRGKEAVFAAFAKTVGVPPLSFKIELHDVLANDEHAVALVHATASRHTFATWAIENQARELDVQYLLGHSTPDMVRRYSATYNSEKAARAHEAFSPADRLGERLAGTSGPAL